MKINITGEPFKIVKSKKHLFVSFPTFVGVYTDGNMISAFPGGPVMALSPCGEYIITNGGVFMATAPFKRIQYLHFESMTAASFSGSFKSFIVLVDGCALGYVVTMTENGLMYTNVFDHRPDTNMLDIVYHTETDSWITADAKGRVARYANSEDWPFDKFFPLKQRTEERKIVSSAPCLFVTKDSVFYGSRFEVEQIMVEDFDAVVPLDKLDYETLDDLENHRSVCTAENGGKYRLSLCGMFIETPSLNQKETEPRKESTKTVSKTGRVYGMMTRSRAKAEAKLTTTKV